VLTHAVLPQRIREELALFGWGPHAFDHGFARLVDAMGLSPAFGAAVDLTTLFNGLKSAQASWLYYFLDSIRRGDRMAGYASDKIRPGALFLDVGCGYGGSLLAAHARGMRVHGIEIEPRALAGARALLAERGVDAPVMDIDVLGPAFDTLPLMDLIVCENVIEHVSDPRAFMMRLFGRLAPGGALVMEIPNGFALRSVTSDPHYALPFLSLLSEPSARCVFERVLGRDVCGEGYSVGDYFPLQWYLGVLPETARPPVVTFREDAILSMQDLPAMLTGLRERLREIDVVFAATPVRIRENLRVAAQAYIDRLEKDFADVTGLPTNDDGQDPLSFAARYLAAAWIVRFDSPAG
jgi:2-polyprenyl-3-methyl-5-hydroxy-6-metoxy-1,4-benzoquinol methylase